MAKTLRANGFTEGELDLLFKINPAKILGIPPPQTTGTRQPVDSSTPK